MSTATRIHGALALECSAELRRLTVSAPVSSELARCVADDLAKLVPGVETLSLVVAGAAFDPSELLRPGWPVHQALFDMAQSALAQSEATILGFGTHDGKMPVQLLPDPDLRDSPLQLVPFVLQGTPEQIEEAGASVESLLLDTGIIGPEMAVFIRKAFNIPLEHARYMTMNDLVAMMAMQFDHAGIGALWTLIENALFSPARECWLDQPPEPLARWDGKQVKIARIDFETWQKDGFAPADIDPKYLESAYRQFCERQRQFEAILGVHAIRTQWESVETGQDARARLAA